MAEHRTDDPRGGAGPGGGAGARGGAGPRADRADRGAQRVAVDPARRVAYEAVAAVHRDDAYANLVLPRMLRERGVTGRDAAFATELTYGSLRLTGTLDAIVARAAQRDVVRIDPPVRDALRLGAYQLLRMRVPAHAAVDSTVDLVRWLQPGAIGFANAVLRQVAERDWDGWATELAPGDPVGQLAFAHAHPEWIVRAFVDVLGGDLDEVALALAADNTPAPVHLCARPGRVSAAALAQESGGEPGRFSPYAVHLAGGAPGDLLSVAGGLAHVQDEGSQLVAAALAAAPLDGRDSGGGLEGSGGLDVVGADLIGRDAAWLDLCAGPGGKAALLGALAAQRGARLTAVEVTRHRADLVSQATRGLPVDVLCEDGREVEGIFDRVLVDAPCTGLGALRRRPEARWRRTPSDLPQLTRLQRELLVAALRVVRPGGIVAYVTCSPHKVETQVTVDQACRRSESTVELVDARPLFAGVPDLGAGPTVQLWPHRHGTDAMYLALIRRTG